jgi:hypothetical protein
VADHFAIVICAQEKDDETFGAAESGLDSLADLSKFTQQMEESWRHQGSAHGPPAGAFWK